MLEREERIANCKKEKIKRKNMHVGKNGRSECNEESYCNISFACFLLAIGFVLLFVYICHRMISRSSSSSLSPSSLSSVIHTPTHYFFSPFLTPQTIYSYCYPLVLTEVTRRYQFQNSIHQEMNKLVHHRELSTSHSPRIVVSPNDSTLYSDAWLQLPVSFTIPVIQSPGRYFVLSVMDVFGNVLFMSEGSIVHTPRSIVLDNNFYPGARWLILRVFCNGSRSDLQSAHQLQDQFSLTALLLSPTLKEDLCYFYPQQHQQQSPPSLIVDHMNTSEFYTLALSLLQSPSLLTYSDVKEVTNYLRKHPPQQTFPLNLRHLPSQQSIQDGLVYTRNHWLYTTQAGKFPATTASGIETRSFFARVLFAASSWPSTCYYLRMNLNPSRSYSLTLDSLPIIQGFWSLTIYNYDFFFQKGSPKYSIHSYDFEEEKDNDKKPLVLQIIPLSIYNEQSSKIQKHCLAVSNEEDPRPVHVIFRIYGPGPDILSQQWIPPMLILKPL